MAQSQNLAGALRPPPPPPPPPPDPNAAAAAEDAKKLYEEKNKRGRASTVLTGAGGLQSPVTSSVRTLLGA